MKISQIYTSMNYTNQQTPGESYWREAYSHYQNWRMKPDAIEYLGSLMTDIDCNTLNIAESFNAMANQEYSYDDDFALLEMKHFRTPQYKIDDIINNFNPTKRLANRAQLPFFVVKYYPAQECGNWQFTVYPANELALKLVSKPRHCSEYAYIEFLFKILRKLEVPNYWKENASYIRSKSLII